MKFINKYTFQKAEKESDKASELNVPSFAVLGTEIVPEIKYTKGIKTVGTEIHNNSEFAVCTEVLEMNTEEKAAVDLAELKQKTNADFRFKRYSTAVLKEDYNAQLNAFSTLEMQINKNPLIDRYEAYCIDYYKDFISKYSGWTTQKIAEEFARFDAFMEELNNDNLLIYFTFFDEFSTPEQELQLRAMEAYHLHIFENQFWTKPVKS